MFAVSKVITSVRMSSFGIDTALSMIRCSKSAEKSVVPVCQAGTVVMETTQLVLSQFKKNLS